MAPEYGALFDSIWKKSEREKRGYGPAQKEAEAANGRRCEAERSLKAEAAKLAEMERRALEMGVDPDAVAADNLVEADDYDNIPTVR